jgi:hypothetical protein
VRIIRSGSALMSASNGRCTDGDHRPLRNRRAPLLDRGLRFPGCVHAHGLLLDLAFNAELKLGLSRGCIYGDRASDRDVIMVVDHLPLISRNLPKCQSTERSTTIPGASQIIGSNSACLPGAQAHSLHFTCRGAFCTLFNTAARRSSPSQLPAKRV